MRRALAGDSEFWIMEGIKYYVTIASDLLVRRPPGQYLARAPGQIRQHLLGFRVSGARASLWQ